MKNLVIYLPILLLILSCDKNQDYDHEVIASNTIYLKNSDLFNTVTCFSISNIELESGFVIDNISDYQKFADSLRIYPYNSDCDTATLIDINFTQYTLIGIQTAHGACDSISREIFVNNKKKDIMYNINIKESNETCSRILYVPLNLALMPKKPDKYKIEFKVNRY